MPIDKAANALLLTCSAYSPTLLAIAMYNWRSMTDDERAAALAGRARDKRPRHTPPTWDVGVASYLITAACYEHRSHIGRNAHRLSDFSAQLLKAFSETALVQAWAVLPNHYHVLARTENVVALKRSLKLLHGRTAFAWNGEERTRGRKVWHAAAETVIKSDGHFWATLNYVHHNPVKHGCANRWQDWVWSSARDFLAEVGQERATALWRSYPVNNYGRNWDI